MTAKLNIVVAFPAEARFFLDQYQLNRIKTASKFPIYQNRQKNIHLIVTGLGKIRSAAAVGYLHAFSGAFTETVYLNAGIAGAMDAGIGEIFLANQIVDSALDKIFYPFMPVWDNPKSCKIITVDKPAKNYSADGLIEMEAAGFFTAALNMVTLEQIQTLKIVSDNQLNPEPNIATSKILDLFARNEAAIIKLIDWMLELSIRESKCYVEYSVYYEELLKNYHFTQYQRDQLQEYLRRWQIIFPAKPLLPLTHHARNSEEIISILNHHLAATWI